MMAVNFAKLTTSVRVGDCGYEYVDCATRSELRRFCFIVALSPARVPAYFTTSRTPVNMKMFIIMQTKTRHTNT